MSIQWYPGHMHKARKEMLAALSGTDALIEVRDARLPGSSANPVLAELGGDLPRLVVLTRADLADPESTKLWCEAIRANGADAVALELGAADAANAVPARLERLAGSASANRPGPRIAMVVGIPNVGKSTLINRLARRQIAATGNEPAVTKRQQTVSLPGAVGERWRLRDTPGVLWPNLSNPRAGYRLAASGAVRDTAMESGDVALALLDELRGRYDARLVERFGRSDGKDGGDERFPLDDALATLDAIGRARGCLGSGGLVDYERAGHLLLSEFRSGKLGRITLETPDMHARESVETDARDIEIEAERERKRELRRERRRGSRGAARRASKAPGGSPGESGPGRAS